MIKEKKILLNYCLYILTGLLICIVGISNCFALTYDNVGYLDSVTTLMVAPDYTDTPITVPIDTSYALAHVTETIVFVDNYNFSANTNYQLELHINRQQFTNVNYYSVQGNNGENCLVSYSNSNMNGQYPKYAFQCSTATNHIVLSLKNTNGSYLWPGSVDNAPQWSWDYAYLRRSSTSIGGQDTDAIINNNNQNTQTIINNFNNNTQNIIDNQNQNTQDIINSNKVCQNIDKSSIQDNGKGLSISGNVFDSSSYGITNYIKIDKNTEIKVLQTFAYHSYCFYTTNKELISCYNNSDLTVNSLINIPNNADYVRFTIHNTQNKPTFEICKNGNQSLNDSINDLDDTLKDDNIDDNNVASSFEDFNEFLDDNSTITQLITLPITLYTAILNNLNGTCQPFNLGKLYGEDLILPCINISQYLGNSLWTMIDIIISGFAVYAISKKMIKVFNNFSSLREGDVIDD